MKYYKISIAVILTFLSVSVSPGGIFVDQVGYLPSALKYVFVNQPADSFWVIEKATNLVQFSGKFNLWKSQDPASGMTLYRGDFSGLTHSGQYIVQS